MSTYTRVITINPYGNGGKAQGVWQKDGVAFNGTPNLANGDVLNVAVKPQGGGTSPASLNGFMIIGPACAVAATQADASPFLNGSKQICVVPVFNIAQVGGLYTFGSGLTMGNPGNQKREFELTFVAVDPATQNQWEEDPEFDTGT